MGTAGTEIKVSSVENAKLTNALPLKPGVGQNIDTHASPTVKDLFIVSVSKFRSIHRPNITALVDWA